MLYNKLTLTELKNNLQSINNSESILRSKGMETEVKFANVLLNEEINRREAHITKLKEKGLEIPKLYN